ncbi:MAG: flagellar hook protein FlgE [Bacteroidota bacterium]|jgi:flagellar hook protein FlgE
MSFLRSLSAGVTGLRNHTLMMDVIGNNVANINTIGFKGSRITFSDMFSQTLRGASSGTDFSGGTNPMQIGLGASVNSLDTMFTQGGIELSGRGSDLAIQGTGFFVVNKNGKQLYTRVGTFERDANGKLVLPGNGGILQGKLADALGNIPSGNTLEDLKIDLDRKSPAKATTLAKFSGNLDASAATGDTTSATVGIYDSQGNPISLSLNFTKSANPNEWTWTVNAPSPSTITGGGTGTVTFNPDGSLNQFSYDGGATALGITTGLGTDNLSIDLNVGTANEFSGITQNKGTMMVSAKDQNGYAAGELSTWDVDQNGFVNASFSNGQVIRLGQVLLAEFSNPGGLMKSGESMYDVSANSGEPVVITAGGESRSAIAAGALEQSNVDLPEEFTKMIVAQRGFQSNARVITTSDEILNEVVNLKR